MSWEEELESLYRAMARQAVNKRFLDVGTGFARNLSILLSSAGDAVVWSVDPDERALERARRKFSPLVECGRLVLVRGRAEELPFEDEFFGLVAAAMTMHHVEDRERAAGEMRRVLARGGYLVLADWTPSFASSLRTLHSPRALEDSMRDVLRLTRGLFEVLEERIERDYYLLVARKRE